MLKKEKNGRCLIGLTIGALVSALQLFLLTRLGAGSASLFEAIGSIFTKGSRIEGILVTSCYLTAPGIGIWQALKGFDFTDGLWKVFVFPLLALLINLLLFIITCVVVMFRTGEIIPALVLLIVFGSLTASPPVRWFIGGILDD